MEERVAMLEDTAREQGLTNVRVTPFDGLLVEFARSQGACAVIRGLRAVSDFEFESDGSHEPETRPEGGNHFPHPQGELTYISSRIVKEIARLGGDVRQFVPANVAAALRSKIKELNR